jgi:adenylate cyclase
LTGPELAEACATGIDRIRELVELGILQPEEGLFSRQDVMRVRVVDQLDSLGIEAAALAEALASGHLTLGYLESAGRRHPRSELSFAEVGEELGIPFPTLERIYLAFGLPRPKPSESVRQEDMEALRMLGVLFGADLAGEDVVRLARVWGDSVRRIAQYVPHHFHTTVEERFRSRGLRDNEAFEASIREVGLRIGRSGEDLLGWLFRRHSEVFMTEHQFAHVETALEDAGVRPRPPRSLEAAVFADLSGFTQLTEESGDQVAVGVSLGLAELVGEAVTRHRGEVVKLLGDGVLLHFRDPGEAITASMEIVESAPSRGLPPAHIGVNAGPMIYEEGDYFGRTVNIASRIASRAGPGQVFVGEAVVANVAANGFRLIEVGEFDLKGIALPIRIFQAIPDRATDE